MGPVQRPLDARLLRPQLLWEGLVGHLLHRPQPLRVPPRLPIHNLQVQGSSREQAWTELGLATRTQDAAL